MFLWHTLYCSSHCLWFKVILMARIYVVARFCVHTIYLRCIGICGPIVQWSHTSWLYGSLLYTVASLCNGLIIGSLQWDCNPLWLGSFVVRSGLVIIRSGAILFVWCSLHTLWKHHIYRSIITSNVALTLWHENSGIMSVTSLFGTLTFQRYHTTMVSPYTQWRSDIVVSSHNSGIISITNGFASLFNELAFSMRHCLFIFFIWHRSTVIHITCGIVLIWFKWSNNDPLHDVYGSHICVWQWHWGSMT